MKTRVTLVISVLCVGIFLIGGCGEGPVKPEEAREKGALKIAMSLAPAHQQDIEITRVNVSIDGSNYSSSQDLIIEGDQAAGTFSQVPVGEYTLHVLAYDHTTVVAAGEGHGTVVPGGTSQAVISLRFVGDLVVIVIWDLPGEELWSRFGQNPLLEPNPSGVHYDSRGIDRAAVLFDDEEQIYKMWYAGWSNSNPARIQIGYATSIDGISWTKYGDQPVIAHGPGDYDSWLAFMPVVMKDEGIYKMWYSGDSYAYNRTCYATSLDGIEWTKHGVVVDWMQVFGTNAHWARYVYAGSILREGDIYRMWFSTGYGQQPWIGHATSPDGLTWTVGESVMEPGQPDQWDDDGLQFPRVVKQDDTYVMVYSSDHNDGAADIGIAFSLDGMTWVKGSTNPVLIPSSSHTWEGSVLRVADIMFRNSDVVLWYSGWSASGWSLGGATADTDDVMALANSGL